MPASWARAADRAGRRNIRDAAGAATWRRPGGLPRPTYDEDTRARPSRWNPHALGLQNPRTASMPSRGRYRNAHAPEGHHVADGAEGVHPDRAALSAETSAPPPDILRPRPAARPQIVSFRDTDRLASSRSPGSEHGRRPPPVRSAAPAHVREVVGSTNWPPGRPAGGPPPRMPARPLDLRDVDEVQDLAESAPSSPGRYRPCSIGSPLRAVRPSSTAVP